MGFGLSVSGVRVEYMSNFGRGGVGFATCLACNLVEKYNHKFITTNLLPLRMNGFGRIAGN